MLVPHESLRKLIAEIIRRGGSDAAEADLVAGHLVDANLAGHDSHGVQLMPAYVRHLQAGLVVPNSPVKVAKDDGAFLMFDGQRGYGRRVAGEAMAMATSRPRPRSIPPLRCWSPATPSAPRARPAAPRASRWIPLPGRACSPRARPSASPAPPRSRSRDSRGQALQYDIGASAGRPGGRRIVASARPDPG